MTDPTRLVATLEDSHSAGTCNFCDRNLPNPNTGRHANEQVVVVASTSPRGGIKVRFCRQCLQDLGRQTGALQ